MDAQLAKVFEKYGIFEEYPESLFGAIQKTRDKIHNLDLYNNKTEEYIKELDKELHKWIKRFIVLLRTEKINTNNFIQLFSKLFSLLKIDKVSIFNA